MGFYRRENLASFVVFSLLCPLLSLSLFLCPFFSFLSIAVNGRSVAIARSQDRFFSY